MADSPERRNVRTFSDAALYSEHSTEQFSGFDMIKNEGMPDGQQRHRKDTDTGHFGGDGAFDQVLKRRKGPVGAIFIHAGAGYHSTTNERVHLAACSDAARAGMKAMKEGGSAVDAIESAIKLLEDKEITNAGYGSNLSMDGIVECDASIVDHLGRSGACGAVPNVKNPISLAKVILEQSSKPLSLRRVPPNLLVGEGARGFAKAYGVPTVPNHELVSKNARDRYLRWQEDLRRAESQEESASGPDDQSIMAEHVDDMRLSSSTSLTGRHREHYQAIMTGTWNEGQPDSPASSSDPGSPASVDSPTRSVSRGGAADISYRPSASRSSSTLNIRCRNHLSPDRTQPAPHQGQSSGHGDPRLLMGSLQRGRIPVPIANVSQGSADRDAQRSPNYGAPMDADGAVSHDESKNEKPATPKVHTDSSPDVGASDPPEDMITDTVGAIAIDFSGNMAAGSSSGGIGMKHRGRIGPAALVGVGTAIIPAADEPPLPPRSSQCARQPGQIPLENGSRSHRRDCQQIATTAVDGGCVHGHHVMGSGKAKQTHHRARHGARGDCTCRDGAEAAENGSDNASSGSTSGSSSSGKDLQSSSASWPNTWSGDDQAVSVAAVTSGTGEHMATTMAAQRIAERLYHSTRRGPGGRTTPEPDEDRALEAFILDDFMDHPGVKNAHSQGAIGVMAVKKARKGFYFYFAHNTESFALASFASDEREPKVVMSRIGDLGEVARGGRKIRID